MTQRMADAGLPWLHWLGAVPEAELAAVYRGAHAVVMPSLYEGFGLPVVEAMSCGVPVIASDAPALVEVAGGAAMHCGTEDAAGFASAVVRLENPEVRGEYVRLGLSNARRFSWDAVAREVTRAIESFAS